jgi:hypothetical protein
MLGRILSSEVRADLKNYMSPYLIENLYREVLGQEKYDIFEDVHIALGRLKAFPGV